MSIEIKDITVSNSPNDTVILNDKIVNDVFCLRIEYSKELLSEIYKFTTEDDSILLDKTNKVAQTHIIYAYFDKTIENADKSQTHYFIQEYLRRSKCE